MRIPDGPFGLYKIDLYTREHSDDGRPCMPPYVVFEVNGIVCVVSEESSQGFNAPRIADAYWKPGEGYAVDDAKQFLLDLAYAKGG
jgi:hypothetical protein